jgi:acyl-homoserine lactone acylase PvdQ
VGYSRLRQTLLFPYFTPSKLILQAGFEQDQLSKVRSTLLRNRALCVASLPLREHRHCQLGGVWSLRQSRYSASTMTQGTEQVQIMRDTWGVPHVFAKSEPGALYGQGYAMAQDRLPTMMRAYRKAVGQMAEAFGPDWIEHDHQQRIWRHAQIARIRYHELPMAWRQTGLKP